MQKRNLYLNPTVQFVLDNSGARVLFVGIDLEGGGLRCTNCYGKAGEGWGHVPWQPADSPSTGFPGAHYVLCNSCVKRFELSEQVRRRFYRKLEKEAPRLRPGQIAKLPTLDGGDANATRH
jgi:hypothetical protein